MTRTLTNDTKTELTESEVEIVFFVEIDFRSGPFRAWSGLGIKSWNGETWLGAGNLLEISPMAETTEIKATGIIITMSGLNSAMVSLALTDAEQNRFVRCYMGFLNPDKTVIVDPYLFFSGLVNFVKIEQDGDVSKVILTAENDLIQLQRPRIRRYTHEDQQIEFPADLGFEHINEIQEWSGFWGSPNIAVPARSDNLVPPEPNREDEQQ